MAEEEEDEAAEESAARAEQEPEAPSLHVDATAPKEENNEAEAAKQTKASSLHADVKPSKESKADEEPNKSRVSVEPTTKRQIASQTQRVMELIRRVATDGDHTDAEYRQARKEAGALSAVLRAAGEVEAAEEVDEMNQAIARVDEATDESAPLEDEESSPTAEVEEAGPAEEVQASVTPASLDAEAGAPQQQAAGRAPAVGHRQSTSRPRHRR
eukprot:TRINITY_DN6568_c0_g1_i3.p1 TRINITY_DN6568_c0_g1~~TRINITY_DN6568_c0_g1_i3.p1  ORF type:complete len:214 (-),score=75.48 TRINITY_DN6568_c0_g1_i3:668-1309(-)